MAFKMRGFNPGKGTGMGSAFTKKNENNPLLAHSKDEAKEVPDTPDAVNRAAGGKTMDTSPKVESGDTKQSDKQERIEERQKNRKKGTKYMKDWEPGKRKGDESPMTKRTDRDEEVPSDGWGKGSEADPNMDMASINEIRNKRKDKREAKTKSPMEKNTYSEAKDKDPELDDKINAVRSGELDPDHEKSIQNQINEAYDVDKKHEIPGHEKIEIPVKKPEKIATENKMELKSPEKIPVKTKGKDKKEKEPRYKKRIRNIQERAKNREERQDKREENQQKRQDKRDENKEKRNQKKKDKENKKKEIQEIKTKYKNKKDMENI